MPALFSPGFLTRRLGRAGQRNPTWHERSKTWRQLVPRAAERPFVGWPRGRSAERHILWAGRRNAQSIVEDNREEAEALRRCIERYGQLNAEQFDVTVMRSAVDYVAEGGAWSVVFMDIDLPGINGMEAAELLRTYDPVTPLIFVTNLAQYAVRGYEVDALGFIVKPVSYNSFRIPMDKAMRAVRQRVPSLLIKTQDGIRLVPQTDVIWVEISGHYLSWHIAGEKDPLNERGSLAQAAEKLAGGSMVSISKSVMANATHIQAIARDTLVMTDGARLAISRSKKREVMAQIAALLGDVR